MDDLFNLSLMQRFFFVVSLNKLLKKKQVQFSVPLDAMTFM